MILHEHICKFDLGCVEVLSRDQKLGHAPAPFLASLPDYIANLVGEPRVQNWEFRLKQGQFSVVFFFFLFTHDSDVHFEDVIYSE
jgi:hypothetical protein